MPRPNIHNARRAENPLVTFKRLITYAFSRYKLLMLLVVIFVIMASAANIIGASRLAPIASELMENGQNANLNLIYKNIIFMGIVYLLGAISSFIYTQMMVYIAQGTLKKLRNEMFEKMQTLPLTFFDTNTHGDLMSIYTNDVDTMRQLLSQTIPQLISSCVTMIIAIIFMIYYSFTLSIVVFIMLALILYFVKFNGNRSSKYFLQQQVALGQLNGFVEEMTTGQKVIKVFCHEEKAKQEFRKLNDKLNNVGKLANTYAFIMGPINGNLSYLQYILVAIVGVVLVVTNNNFALLSWYCNNNGNNVAVAAGMLISFLAYSRQVNGPVQQVSQQFNAIVMALGGAERIFSMLDMQSEDSGGNVILVKKDTNFYWQKKDSNGSSQFIPLKGDIRFNHVTFSYNKGKVILNDISLYAKPGQKIAFVGATGAGKTTITNLINRFYDIDSGQITYDGINIKEIKKSDLRKSLGMVLQDTHLFTGTVMDNIRYGRLDASDEDCIAAAKLANADFFISHLPDGYNTTITGDGTNLSQGQRQLLNIARAMVSNCPVLILDEATSSIDTYTEHLIEKGMDKLMEGKTVFVIAHRLSTVRNSQAIMVLEHGEIIERGTHEQLLAMKGKYYQLYTGAFELE